MKSYCILFNRENKQLKNKIKKNTKQLKVKKKKINKLYYHSLNDWIVPPYVKRIDETLFSDDKYCNTGFILEAKEKNKTDLENVLEEDFKEYDVQKDNDESIVYKKHKEALDSLRTTRDTIYWGTGILGASILADTATTIAGFMAFYPYVQEQNPIVNFLMNQFQNAGIDLITSLTLGCLIGALAPQLSIGFLHCKKSNNVVTDGKNTYFHRKPYDGIELKVLYGLLTAIHIYAVGSNLRLIEIFSQALVP